MAQRNPATFDVTCPGCQARLTVDPEVKAVLQHTPAPRSGPLASLDKALEAIKGEQAKRDARFREATEAEKSKDQLLTRKFEAGLKRAKDTPEPPRRPFDFD